MIDVSEVRALARDFERADGRALVEARKIAKRSALEIKRGMQRDFSGHNYSRNVPRSLEFEAIAADPLHYEIGELDSGGPQWGIAAILAFGTSNNAPVVDHTRALAGEAEKAAGFLGKAGEGAVLGSR